MNGVQYLALTVQGTRTRHGIWWLVGAAGESLEDPVPDVMYCNEAARKP